MVWVRSPVYFYNRNGTYYFSRAVPSDLRHRFPKRKIEVSLRTKSESKAARSAAALSDRLERYWDSLAKSGDSTVDQLRVALLQALIILAEPRHHPGAKIFNKNVSGGQ